MVGSSHVNMGSSLSLVLTDHPLSSALVIHPRRCTPLPHICSPVYHLLRHIMRPLAKCFVVETMWPAVLFRNTTNTMTTNHRHKNCRFIKHVFGQICKQHPWWMPHFRYCAIMCMSLSLSLVLELVTRDGISRRGISKFEDSTRKLSSRVLGQSSKHRSKHDQVLFV